jgi:adenylate kinase
MRLALIGGPGSGKGTQAKRLAERFGLEHVSLGALLRRHIDGDTKIGRAAKEYVERGDLVPDELVLEMLRERVRELADGAGYVLDGFPRTIEQAEAAGSLADEVGGELVQQAIHLDVPREELASRLSARARGADDEPDVVEHRLNTYENEMRPLLDHYARRGKLLTVDGARPADEVTRSLVEALTQSQASQDS